MLFSFVPNTEVNHFSSDDELYGDIAVAFLKHDKWMLSVIIAQVSVVLENMCSQLRRVL
jgi:hypothetical protein